MVIFIKQKSKFYSKNRIKNRNCNKFAIERNLYQKSLLLLTGNVQNKKMLEFSKNKTKLFYRFKEKISTFCKKIFKVNFIVHCALLATICTEIFPKIAKNFRKIYFFVINFEKVTFRKHANFSIKISTHTLENRKNLRIGSLMQKIGKLFGNLFTFYLTKLILKNLVFKIYLTIFC